MLPEPQQPKQLQHLRMWPSLGADPSPPGQPQEQTRGDNPHAKVEIKPQLKAGDSVPKEEYTEPSHQLYKLQIKST